MCISFIVWSYAPPGVRIMSVHIKVNSQQVHGWYFRKYVEHYISMFSFVIVNCICTFSIIVTYWLQVVYILRKTISGENTFVFSNESGIRDRVSVYDQWLNLNQHSLAGHSQFSTEKSATLPRKKNKKNNITLFC